MSHSELRTIHKNRHSEARAAAHNALNVPPDMISKTDSMKEHQFLFLQQLLTSKTGIRFSNRDQLALKLSSRLRALNLDTYAQYIELIKEKTDEIPYAIEAITNNETFFFRDFKHLIALEKHLDKKYNPACDFKIWSAASSSGEEAYSIAMTVHAWATHRNASLRTIRIIGSDIDRTVLKRANTGLYHRTQIERTPKNYWAFLRRYLEKAGDDYYSVTAHIKKMVRFQSFNLTQPLPFNQTLDVIFCRNVFMYFKQDLRNKILASMHRALRPGGLLVMGMCEPIPMDLPLGFKFTGNSIYIKAEH